MLIFTDGHLHMQRAEMMIMVGRVLRSGGSSDSGRTPARLALVAGPVRTEAPGSGLCVAV